MYNQIADNQRKSWLLIAIFTGLLAVAGWLYGYVFSDAGLFGIIIALAVSIGMSLVSWFAGDQIALSSSGAVEITQRDEAMELWNVVENLSITNGLPMPKIYVIHEAAPNAFATGRDPKHASIAVTTGLLEHLDKTELEGVLAHELSHVKNYDIRVMMIVIVLVGTLSLLGNWFLRSTFHRSRDKENPLNPILLVIGIAFLILAPVVGELIKLAVSRRREYLADASGALLTRYPEGLARALEKIRDANLPMARTSPATNHLWISAPVSAGFAQSFSNFFSTHPPIDDRIARLRAMISS